MDPAALQLAFPNLPEGARSLIFEYAWHLLLARPIDCVKYVCGNVVKWAVLPEMLSEKARELVDYDSYDRDIFCGLIPAGPARPRVWQEPLVFFDDEVEDFGELEGENAPLIAARRHLLLFRLLTRPPAASARWRVG